MEAAYQTEGTSAAATLTLCPRVSRAIYDRVNEIISHPCCWRRGQALGADRFESRLAELRLAAKRSPAQQPQQDVSSEESELRSQAVKFIPLDKAPSPRRTRTQFEKGHYSDWRKARLATFRRKIRFY